MSCWPRNVEPRDHRRKSLKFMNPEKSSLIQEVCKVRYFVMVTGKLSQLLSGWFKDTDFGGGKRVSLLSLLETELEQGSSDCIMSDYK